MVRSGILGIVLFSFISSVSFAVPTNNDELAKKFSEAQGLAKQGQITQAISAYQALIKSNPLLPEAYNNLAALYLKQKNTKQAKFILEQGLHAHKGYGVLYESLTAINVAMARNAYSKALQIKVKPSDINIATLSYDQNNQSRNASTIVISNVETPIKNNTVAAKPAANSKPITQAKVVSVTKPKPSGTIKRDSVITQAIVTAAVKPVNNSEAIETVLKAWSAAWSAQAADVYLSFYHQHYKPSSGMSRNAWKQARRYRLKKPSWIKISLTDINIEKNTDKQAVVKFKQVYQSNSFRDVSDKQMVLIYTDDGWQIYREKSL